MRDDIANLELGLTHMGRAIAYPTTPDMVSRVQAQITAPPAKESAPPRAWAMAGAAFAAAVVLIAAGVSIASPAREAVAGLFDRIDIFTTDEVPEDLTSDFRGEEVSLDEAEARFGRRLLLPATSDESPLAPSSVVYQDFRPTRAMAVALFFETDGGTPFVILQTDTSLGKGLGPGAAAEPVRGVGDGEAYWLQGLRIVQLYDGQGNFIEESQRRTDASTLIWIQDGLVLRLEGYLSRDEAIEIARSMK